MKTTMTAVMVVLGLTTTVSFAQQQADIVCESPSFGNGLSVEIFYDAKQGDRAVVSETGFFGKEVVLDTAVRKSKIDKSLPAVLRFDSKSFEIEIQLEKVNGSTLYPAHLVSEYDNKQISEDMLCEVNE